MRKNQKDLEAERRSLNQTVPATVCSRMWGAEVPQPRTDEGQRLCGLEPEEVGV